MKKIIYIFIATIVSIILFVIYLYANNRESNIVNDINLSLVTTPLGLVANQYAGTENGCYEVFSYPDNHANIIYADYNKKVKIFLSSDLSSDPFSDNNTSYIPDRYGMVKPIALDKRLVIIHSNTVNSVKWSGIQAASCIYTMDFNGENRKKLYTFDSNEWISTSSGIAASDTHLFFIDNYLNFDNKHICQLVSVNLNSGEKVVLYELDAQKQNFIIGAYNNYLIMDQFDTSNLDNSLYGKPNIYVHNLYSFDIVTNNISNIMSYNNTEKQILSYNDSLIVGDEEKIYSINLNDNSTNDIFNLNELPSEYTQIRLRPDIYDNHLLLDAIGNSDKIKFLSIDMDNSELLELNLYSNNIFCGIFAENDKYFYIQIGKKPYTIEDIDPAGNKILNESEVLDMGLILKDDYWNNNLNIIPIKDYVFTN